MRSILGIAVNLLIIVCWICWQQAAYSEEYKYLLGTFELRPHERFHIAAWTMWLAGMLPFSYIFWVASSFPEAKNKDFLIVAVLATLIWILFAPMWFVAMVIVSMSRPSWREKWKEFWRLFAILPAPQREVVK